MEILQNPQTLAVQNNFNRIIYTSKFSIFSSGAPYVLHTNEWGLFHDPQSVFFFFTFYNPRVFCNLEHINPTQFDIVKNGMPLIHKYLVYLYILRNFYSIFFNIVIAKICSRHLHTLNLYDRKVNKIQMFIFTAKIF